MFICENAIGDTHRLFFVFFPRCPTNVSFDSRFRIRCQVQGGDGPSEDEQRVVLSGRIIGECFVRDKAQYPTPVPKTTKQSVEASETSQWTRYFVRGLDCWSSRGRHRMDKVLQMPNTLTTSLAIKESTTTRVLVEESV